MAEKLAQLLIASAVGMALLLSFGAVTGLGADATIQAEGTTIAWSPNMAQINPGGSVEFKNKSTTVSHGIRFESPPATPSCTGVVGEPAQTNWSGTCTFAQAGTYNFVCTLHPSMTGTITVGTPTPVATTGTASSRSDTGATLNGTVNPKGQATKYLFEWGTSAAYGEVTEELSAGSGSTAVSKSAVLTGLSPLTTYHFRIVAKFGTNEHVNGLDQTFMTGDVPTATTGSASGIGPISATLNGTVNPKGLETKYWFNYGPTNTYGQKTAETTVAGTGTSGVSVSKLVAGLAPETEYHFQVVAKNAAGGGMEVKGDDKTFTTTGGPVATTGAATEVSETAAKLGGVVNPRGQATKYWFNYGTSNAYGQKTAEVSAGSGSTDVPAAQQLTGLSPETTYHFQLVAKSTGGETKGLDKTFTTASPPPAPPPPPPSPPAPLPPAPPIPVPDTTITGKPPARTHDRTPTIKFKASVGGASFQCSVDTKPFKSCRSPYTAPSLKPGRHKLRVQAVVGGVADPTPASVSFKVVAGRK